MTLNVTLITPGYIIQASDRRMVSLPDGKVVDDSANKGVVLQTDDGIFAVTFAGVGLFRKQRVNQRVDLWLAERMAAEGVPEMPIRDGVEVVARLAADLFATFIKASDKRHTFVLAGWEDSDPAPRARVWSISNCAAADGKMRERADEAFDVREHSVRASALGIYAFGLHQAIARSDRRRLRAALRSLRRSDQVEQAIVALIRGAAAKPAWSWGINGEVLAIVLAPSGEVSSTFHPIAIPPANYAPLFVRNQGIVNTVVGDAEIPSPSHFAYRFGRTMLVSPLGGKSSMRAKPLDVEGMGFRCQVLAAKFKRDDEGEEPIRDDEGEEPIVMVEMIPLTEEARRMFDADGPKREVKAK